MLIAKVIIAFILLSASSSVFSDKRANNTCCTEKEIMQSIIENNQIAFTDMIRKGLDVNREINGHSLLEYSVQIPRYDITKKLVENGADINIKFDENYAIIFLLNKASVEKRASKEKNNPTSNRELLDIIKLFLNSGADVNSPVIIDKKTKISALSIAIKSEDLDIIEKILQKINPKILEDEKYPPIFSAIDTRNLEIINLLLEYGRNLEQTTKITSSELSAAEYAARKFPIALQNNIRTLNNTTLHRTLIIALASKNHDLLDTLIHSNIPLDYFPNKNQKLTPLTRASINNDLISIKKLIAAKADPCLKDKNGDNFINIAIRRNYSNIIEFSKSKNIDCSL